MELFLKENLKALRATTRMNQQDFAALFGLGDSTYGNYETGYTRQPDLVIVKRIATHFGLMVDDLLYRKVDTAKLSHLQEPSGYTIVDQPANVVQEASTSHDEFMSHMETIRRIYRRDMQRLEHRILELEDEIRGIKKKH